MRLNKKEKFYIQMREIISREIGILDMQDYNVLFVLGAIEMAGKEMGINLEKIAKYDSEQLFDVYEAKAKELGLTRKQKENVDKALKRAKKQYGPALDKLRRN